MHATAGPGPGRSQELRTPEKGSNFLHKTFHKWGAIAAMLVAQGEEAGKVEIN